jgi:hypothetical protein
MSKRAKQDKGKTMPYCKACQSYHFAPRSRAHWIELQCFDDYAGEKSQFVGVKKMKKECEIIGPRGGWRANAYYMVEVSMNDSNPLFHAIMFTGFLSPTGQPGGYNFIRAPGTEVMELGRDRIRFLRALSHLCDHDDFNNRDNYCKLPTDKDLNTQPAL